MNLNEDNIALHEGSNQREQAEGSSGGSPKHDGIGPFNDVNLPGVWFYKIPHKVYFQLNLMRYSRIVF